MTCKKCKSENLVMRPNAKNPTATELICADCGTWQKFISKEEIRVIEIHNKTKKTRITNADRIRGMSDEELSEFMAGCDAYHEHGTPMQWLPWLQSPAETEGKE
jgi:transcription initiation factor TFIIIB Brf1 subunit/transcription initiation factor TFIIB